MLALHYILIVLMLYASLFFIFNEMQKKKIRYVNSAIIGILLIIEVQVGSFELYHLLSNFWYQFVYTILASVLMLYAIQKLRKIPLLFIMNIFVVLTVNLGMITAFLLLGIEFENVLVNPFYSSLGATFGLLLFSIVYFKVKFSDKFKEIIIITLLIDFIGIGVFIYFAGVYFRTRDTDNAWLILLGLSMLIIGTTQVTSPILMTLKDSKIKEGEKKERLHEQNYEAQEKHYQTLSEKDSETIKFRHDIKMQLRSGLALLNSGKVDLANCHFESLLGGVLLIDDKTKVNTGSDVLDANLNELLVHDGYKNVEFTLNGMIPTNLKMTTSDITSLFVNLIQNAFEATSMLKEGQFVNVNISTKASSLFIGVENSYDGKLNILPSGKFKTRKDLEEFHGYGTKIIDEIVNKYSGDIRIFYDNKIFKVEISFGMDIYEKTQNVTNFPENATILNGVPQ